MSYCLTYYSSMVQFPHDSTSLNWNLFPCCRIDDWLRTGSGIERMCVVNWIFERSSGYAGRRCTDCAVWVYEGKPLVCNCSKNKKKTTVHRYKGFYRWRGKKFAANRNGSWLLSTEITEAGFDGVKFIDHRRRKKIFLMSREAM